MASFIPESRAERPHQRASFTTRMSRNIAFALLVYTMLMIFFVAPSMAKLTASLAPYFALLLLVAIVIPFCRVFEKRWQRLEGSELSSHGLDLRFRVDQVKIWGLAVIVPIGLTLFFRSLAAIA